jgi:hypothetical protein
MLPAFVWYGVLGLGGSAVLLLMETMDVQTEALEQKLK